MKRDKKMENYSTILLKGTEYIITFDMNVMAHIQEVYDNQ